MENRCIYNVSQVGVGVYYDCQSLVNILDYLHIAVFFILIFIFFTSRKRLVIINLLIRYTQYINLMKYINSKRDQCINCYLYSLDIFGFNRLLKFFKFFDFFSLHIKYDSSFTRNGWTWNLFVNLYDIIIVGFLFTFLYYILILFYYYYVKYNSENKSSKKFIDRFLYTIESNLIFRFLMVTYMPFWLNIKSFWPNFYIYNDFYKTIYFIFEILNILLLSSLLLILNLNYKIYLNQNFWKYFSPLYSHTNFILNKRNFLRHNKKKISLKKIIINDELLNMLFKNFLLIVLVAGNNNNQFLIFILFLILNFIIFLYYLVLFSHKVYYNLQINFLNIFTILMQIISTILLLVNFLNPANNLSIGPLFLYINLIFISFLVIFSLIESSLPQNDTIWNIKIKKQERNKILDNKINELGKQKDYLDIKKDNIEEDQFKSRLIKKSLFEDVNLN